MDKKIIGLSDELIIHPGETLQEILEDRQMTQGELSVITDVTEDHVSKIIRGQMAISLSYAKKLEYALNIDASFWINLQNIEDDWNQGGSPDNIKEVIMASEIDNIQNLYSIIVENGPVYARYANSKGEGHAIVITGVSVYKNKVYTNNPWGKKGSQSYNDFLSGVAKKWYQGGQGFTLDRIYILG